MSLWSPTHVQFTGNNDVFVTIQLGKEKYQTSTIKNALNPEWFEECDLRSSHLERKLYHDSVRHSQAIFIEFSRMRFPSPSFPSVTACISSPIPHMGLEIEVSLYHRRVLSDDFLGYAAIPLWEYKITEASKSSWVKLHNRSSKPGGNKYRGELEIKLTFHCQSRTDVMPHGLRKTSPSLRNLTSAFGDKFKLRRSRSFRDNRRDSDTGKMTIVGKEPNVSSEGQEAMPVMGLYPYPHSHPSVHFSALDINRTPWGVNLDTPDTLTRSYSMSAAYIKSMSLDRSTVTKYLTNSTANSNNNFATNSNSISNFVANSNNSNALPNNGAGSGTSESYTQSLYSLPNRRSSEVLFTQLPPPAYDFKLSSKDDSGVMPSGDDRRVSDQQTSVSLRSSLPSGSSHFEPAKREVSGIYESIKEKTEPENSASSSSDPESVPGPRPRGKRFSKKDLLSKRNTSQEHVKQNVNVPISGVRPAASDQQPFNGRDSGILDDPSSSLGNSLEGSLATTDGTNNGSKVRSQPGLTNDCNMNQAKLENHLSNTRGDRGILYHLDREMSMSGSMRSKKKVPPPSLFYSKENKYGELVVKKRSRGQRDRDRSRLLQKRQGASGLYDDSVSDHSDSSRNDVPDDLLSVFKNMTKEELLRVLITSKAQMIRKDQYIKDLENYIDDLLVRVMETTPRLLTRQPFNRL